MDEKGELIETLERLDDGFTTTYELVKDTVQKNPEQYRVRTADAGTCKRDS